MLLNQRHIMKAGASQEPRRAPCVLSVIW